MYSPVRKCWIPYDLPVWSFDPVLFNVSIMSSNGARSKKSPSAGQKMARARSTVRRALRRRRAPPGAKRGGDIPAMYVRPQRRAAVPRITARGNDMKIVHSEPLGSITSTGTTFQVFSWPVQPGMSTTFPWLSNMANMYETYTITKLVFRFENAVGTSTAGFMTLAVDLDPVDPAPISMQEVGQYRDSLGAPVFVPHVLNVNAKLMNQTPGLHTRVGLVAGTDLKTYDAGNFYLCIEGVAALLVGYVYVDYDITLHTPQPPEIAAGTYVPTAPTDAEPMGAITGVFTGHMPLQRTSTTTLTFTDNWQGLMGIRVGGTVITNMVTTGTATITSESGFTVNAAQTVAVGVWRVLAKRGDTMIFAPASTTTDVVYMWFGAGSYVDLNAP